MKNKYGTAGKWSLDTTGDKLSEYDIKKLSKFYTFLVLVLKKRKRWGENSHLCNKKINTVV